MLGINVIKYVPDLYGKCYKILMNANRLNKCSDVTCSWIGRLSGV